MPIKSPIDYLHDMVLFLEGAPDLPRRSPDSLPTATDTDWASLRIAGAELMALPAALAGAAANRDPGGVREALVAILMAPAKIASEMVTPEHGNRVAALVQASAFLVGALKDAEPNTVLALDTLQARRDAAGLSKRWNAMRDALFSATGDCCHTRLFETLFGLYSAPEMVALLKQFGLDGDVLAKGIKRAYNIIKQVKNYATDREEVQRFHLFPPEQATIIAELGYWDEEGGGMRFTWSFGDGSKLILDGQGARYEGGEGAGTISGPADFETLAQVAADWYRVHLAADAEGIGHAGLHDDELKSPHGFVESGGRFKGALREMTARRAGDRRMLIDVLDNPNPNMVRQLARRLGRANDAETVDVLAEVLQAMAMNLRDARKMGRLIAALSTLVRESGNGFDVINRAAQQARLPERALQQISLAIRNHAEGRWMTGTGSVFAPQGEDALRDQFERMREGELSAAEQESLAHAALESIEFGRSVVTVGLPPPTPGQAFRNVIDQTLRGMLANQHPTETGVTDGFVWRVDVGHEHVNAELEVQLETSWNTSGPYYTITALVYLLHASLADPNQTPVDMGMPEEQDLEVPVQGVSRGHLQIAAELMGSMIRTIVARAQREAREIADETEEDYRTVMRDFEYGGW